MNEINWFIIDRSNNDIPIESHRLIYKNDKVIERSYITLDTNEYIRII